nr:O-antigen ligase family protein [uncultured Desulfobacter sp.]
MKSTVYSKAVLTIICILIVFTPLARGSVHPWASSVMQFGVILSCLLLVIESLHFDTVLIPKTPLNLPLFVLVVMAGVSMMVSPHRALAWQGYLMLLTYVGVYLLGRSVVRTREQQRLVVYTIIGTALFLSVFGLFKRFGVNPFPFWQYDELRYSPEFVSATYGNHNHLAGFIEMALPFLLVLLLTRTRSVAWLMVIIYLALVLVAVQALTLSRGGWAAMAFSIAFMVMMLLSQKRFYSKKLILVLTGITLVISVFILASSPIVSRVMTVAQKDEAASAESRVTAWKGTVEMIKDYPFFGTGPGTYSAEFPAYQPPGLGVIFKHAHNDYLHFTADMGLWVIPVMIWMLVVFFKAGFKNRESRSRQTSGFALAAMVAVVAILVHSIVDFNLHIPANAFVFCVIVSVFQPFRYKSGQPKPAERNLGLENPITETI